MVACTRVPQYVVAIVKLKTCVCLPAEVLGSLSDWAVVSVGPPANDAELQLTAILNPLTREAQRLSQVLLLLKDVLNPSVRLYLNPQLDLSELPLKSYYR